jgi:elongation factor Ts
MDKIVEGRVNKLLDEKVLMRQVYIRDGEKTVQDVVNAVIAKLGENISVRRFERWELGEHSEDAGDE